MIKVTDKFTKKEYYFPRERYFGITHGHKPMHILKLYGIGEEEYEIGMLQDGNLFEDFYSFRLNFSDIPDGEYKYTIDDYERGLIIIGDLTVNSIAPSDKDTYNQYENKDAIIYYE